MSAVPRVGAGGHTLRTRSGGLAQVRHRRRDLLVHRVPCTSLDEQLTGGPLLLNKDQLAKFLGYSEQTLTQWQEDGMPIARRAEVRGQANEYDTAAVVAWLLDRAARKARADNPKDALYRTQVQLNQIKLDELNGRLVDLHEAEAGFVRLVVNTRQALLQLPEILADELANVPAGTVRKRMQEEILRALLNLSRTPPAIDMPETSG